MTADRVGSGSTASERAREVGQRAESAFMDRLLTRTHLDSYDQGFESGWRAAEAYWMVAFAPVGDLSEAAGSGAS